MQATFSLYSPSEVIGQDFELADVGNPEGYIMGFGVYLCATLDNGARYLGARVAEVRRVSEVREVEADWEAALDRMNRAGARIVGAWVEVHPVYGSARFEEVGAEGVLDREG